MLSKEASCYIFMMSLVWRGRGSNPIPPVYGANTLTTEHPVTLKQLNSFKRYVQLSRWYSGIATDCGARVPGFNFRLWQGFFIFVLFLFYLLCCYMCTTNTSLIMQCCKSFYYDDSLNILNTLQNLWPIIMASRYRPSIFKPWTDEEATVITSLDKWLIC